MSRSRIIPVVLGLAATVAAVVAAVAGASGSATPTTLTLVGVQLPKTEVYVDNAGKGDGPGDVIIFAQRLHRGAASGSVVGRLEAVCTHLNARGSRCDGTMFLPRGTIVAGGPVLFGQRVSRLPVMGGTKGYAGVRGEIRFSDVGETAQRYVVTLLG